ncbi:hypothetical protein SK128_016990 [Halocaridina rubra]|uniref:WAP domain-containing protein n=1 Tax=Halocaridina rubra TaxID=373956 RepID=A0AAN9AHJ8_HALRR
MKGLQLIFIASLAVSAYTQETNKAETDSADTPNTRFGPGIGGGFGGVGGFNPGIGGGFLPGIGAGIGVSQTCRYWCRTPEGQAYCCEGNEQPQSAVGVKPGFCPPVRPVCPPVRNFAPPSTCSNDFACSGVDKCCYDRCLVEHICKPPIGSGGFGFGGGGFPGFGGGFGR